MDLNLFWLFLFCLFESRVSGKFLDKNVEGNVSVQSESTNDINGLNSFKTRSSFYRNICDRIEAKNEIERTQCFFMCIFIQDFCSNKENGFEECMSERFKKDNFALYLTISGCKIHGISCDYSKWSEWSKCSKDCVSNEYFPTRYRTREVINNNDYIDCSEDELKTIQFEICADLPPCKSIKTSIKISDGKGLKGNIKEKISELPKWIKQAIDTHPELIKLSLEYNEEDEKNNKYQIMKSVKNLGILSNKCGCSIGYEQVKFVTFIQSKKMIKQMEELCMLNKYNQLAFEEHGRYVYYCLNNMMFKEIENRAPTCEEKEDTEYIACRKIYEKETEWILSMIYEVTCALGRVLDEILEAIFKLALYIVIGGFFVWMCNQDSSESMYRHLE